MKIVKGHKTRSKVNKTCQLAMARSEDKVNDEGSDVYVQNKTKDEEDLKA